jgi:hypothetical protein
MTFKRWCVVFKHDKSPVDECLFTHKAKAELLKPKSEVKMPLKKFMNLLALNKYQTKFQACDIPPWVPRWIIQHANCRVTMESIS